MLVHVGCGEAPRGGAIELSWALRDHTDGFVSCTIGKDDASNGDITFIQLDWTVRNPGADDEVGSDFWPCDNNDERHGATEFEVPEGQASLIITPRCFEANVAAHPATYRTPTPIVRTVKRGQIVTLGAVVIEIEREPTVLPGEPSVEIPGICQPEAPTSSTSPNAGPDIAKRFAK
jgi:predicted SnoaL-like aldol condensation-catalyzing enzyme